MSTARVLQTSRQKSSVFFFLNFIILIKKLLNQQNTWFRSSESFKKDNCAIYSTCMHYRQQAWIVTQRPLEVDGLMTGNQPKNLRFMSCDWQNRSGSVTSNKHVMFFMNEINDSVFGVGIV